MTAVAIWMPWLFLATDRVFRVPGGQGGRLAGDRRRARRLGRAHPDKRSRAAAGGLYALARASGHAPTAPAGAARLICWTLGTCLGLGLAAVQILPLAVLPGEEPGLERPPERAAGVVEDRSAAAARRGLHGGSLCLRQPAPGPSQPGASPGRAQLERVGRRLRRAGNLDLAGSAGRRDARPRSLRVAFLAGLVVFGAMGAFRWPPVDNLLRALPVLDVTDNRRLTLWVAFGLTLLGGIGLDQLGQSRPPAARLDRCLGRRRRSFLGSSACAIPSFERQLRERAVAHYRQAALGDPGADANAYHAAGRSPGAPGRSSFSPRYYGLVAVELGVLAALAACLRRRSACPLLDSARSARPDACSTWPCSASVSIRRFAAEIHRSSRR